MNTYETAYQNFTEATEIVNPSYGSVSAMRHALDFKWPSDSFFSFEEQADAAIAHFDQIAEAAIKAREAAKMMKALGQEALVEAGNEYRTRRAAEYKAIMEAESAA